MKYSIYFFFCLFITTLQAQTSLHGMIVGAGNKPVDYFYAGLLSEKDSVFIAGAAFTNGVYDFKGLKAQNCILKITSLGCSTAFENITLAKGANQLNPITLQPTAMREITVIARRPVIQSKADRTIVSVEGSVLASTLNGVDMLQKTPGLIRDPNGELIVAGKGVPKYYVDGKEVHSMTEVKILNPLNIKSIEIIDNPSSAYDAEGHAVVLINTIKRMDQYQLRIGGDFTQSRRSSGSGFIEGTLKTGVVTSNFYIDHSISNNKTFENNYSMLSFNNTMDTHATSISHDSENSYRLSVDIDVAKNQTLTFQDNGYYVDNSTNDRNQFSHFSSSSFSDFNTHMNQFLTTWQNNSTLNYTYRIDTLGQAVKVLADYTVGNKQKTSKFYNQVVGDENNMVFWNNNDNKNTPTIYSIKGDYTKPLGKKATLEAGLKYYWIKGDNITDLKGSTDLYQHYQTDEQNLAAYTSFNLKFNKKFELRIGVRAEETHRKARKDDVAYMNVSQFGLFPSALINYKFSENFTTGVSYSKRISRPTFSALDPSLYVDSLTNRRGNPNLNPTEIHSIQVSFKLFSSLSLRTSYNYSVHPIYFLVYKDNLQPQLTDVRFENGDNVGRYNISLSYNKQLFDWWSTTLSGTVFTNSYPYYDESNIKRDNNTAGRNATVQNTITILKKYTFDVGFQYNGKGSWATIYNEPYWNLYFSLQRSFFHDALSCTLSANDIFNQMTSHQHSVLSGRNMNVYDQDDRYVGISIKYQIGKSKYKYTSKSDNSEERQRVR